MILPLAISCVSVESRFVFDINGTGQLHLKYRLDAMLMELGSTISDQAVLSPITERNFLDVVKEGNGLELIDYRRVEEKDATIILVTLNFDRVDLLAKIPSFPFLKLSSKENGSATFELKIGDNDVGPVPNDELFSVFDGLLGNHTVSFVIETPRIILESNHGIISDDGRELTVSILLSDYIRGTNPRDLEVNW